MCQTCGCGIVTDVAIDGTPVVQTGATPDHGRDPAHAHPHPGGVGSDPRLVDVHQGILEKNDRLAEQNRGFLRAKRVLAVNVLASPGAGKTTFIERMAADLAGRLRLGVIVGDLATDNDARRLRAAGVPAVQVTTGTTCHLDAAMVTAAMEKVPLDDLDLLVIENVGNLVCPASYDLGEDLRVVLLSVTEGEDKPLKYPIMFRSADAVVVSKTDIATAVGFDREGALASIRRVAPRAPILEVSAKTGRGMEDWYAFLTALHAGKRR